MRKLSKNLYLKKKLKRINLKIGVSSTFNAQIIKQFEKKSLHNFKIQYWPK
jgi:hypothetical protein